MNDQEKGKTGSIDPVELGGGSSKRKIWEMEKILERTFFEPKQKEIRGKKKKDNTDRIRKVHLYGRAGPEDGNNTLFSTLRSLLENKNRGSLGRNIFCRCDWKGTGKKQSRKKVQGVAHGAACLGRGEKNGIERVGKKNKRRKVKWVKPGGQVGTPKKFNREPLVSWKKKKGKK